MHLYYVWDPESSWEDELLRVLNEGFPSAEEFKVGPRTQRSTSLCQNPPAVTCRLPLCLRPGGEKLPYLCLTACWGPTSPEWSTGSSAAPGAPCPSLTVRPLHTPFHRRPQLTRCSSQQVM